MKVLINATFGLSVNLVDIKQDLEMRLILKYCDINSERI
jgi:hypothetical protein